MAVDLEICCPAKPAKEPEADLKLFQFVGSSVDAPTLSQDSSALFPTCCCAKKLKTRNIPGKSSSDFFMAF
jgi:hypothetical protein